MTILRSKGKKAVEGKMIGVIFPQQLNYYFTLYSLAKSKTMSVVMRDRMEEWCRKERKRQTEADLIQQIIERAKREWKARESHFQSLIIFKQELADDLKKRGVEEIDIFTIISAIE